MAVSQNSSSNSNSTFRNHRRKMGKVEVWVWESISMSVTNSDGDDTPEEEVNVQVHKEASVILIAYVHGRKRTFIRFREIQHTTSPAVDKITLELKDRDKVIFKFGTQTAKDAFYEAISIVSSDSGNSEESSS